MSGWQSDNDVAAFLLPNDLLAHPPTKSHLGSRSDYDTNFKLFADKLRELGVPSVSLTQIALEKGKEALLDFFVRQLECTKDDHSAEIPEEELHEFKRHLVQSMGAEQLGQLVTHVHSFKIHKGKEGVRVKSFTVQPLADLYSLGAQFVTAKGVVLSASPSVRHAANVVRLAAELFGIKVAAEVPEPLRFSGSDYVAAGPHLAFIGVGPSTNEATVRYLLDNDAFGTTRVAVVRDLFDRDDRRKDLDAVFKIVGPASALIAGGILGKDNLRRRLVNEYTRVDGTYHLTRLSVEFSHYLQEVGFHLTEVPEELHNEVGIPVVNLGLGKLVVADSRVSALLQGSNHFKGSIEHLELKDKSSLEHVAKSVLLFRKSTEGSNAVGSAQVSLPERPAWKPADGPDVPRRQTTNSILMVAPIGFQTNVETAADNYFMQQTNATALEIEKKALLEFSALHRQLTEAGVTIFLQCSERFHKTPDAVFPNNWFSTHARAEVDNKESLVAFYPMKTESRRAERRQNIITDLVAAYDREMSFTQWENSDFPEFFESTGVLIMDRVRKIAYIALSQRCSARVAREWAKRLGYQLCMFHCTDDKGRPIYHTNVMMSVGTTVAVVCLEAIADAAERRNLVDTLKKTHEIVEISLQQVNQFCGNVLELKGLKDGKERKLMLMSTKAYHGFTAEQKGKMLEHVDELVHADLDTIETIGGGGARCMMGELF